MAFSLARALLSILPTARETPSCQAWLTSHARPQERKGCCAAARADFSALGLCRSLPASPAVGQKERASFGAEVVIMSRWVKWGSGEELSTSAARFTALPEEFATTHLSSALHTSAGSRHTTLLLEKKAQASADLSVPLLLV